MGGRNAQPIDILKAQGKKHLTKDEIKKRKESEIKLGCKELLCPAYIKDDTTAFSKWREIKHIYKDVDFVSSGDTGLLARYCMTHSEYIKLIEMRRHVDAAVINWDEYEKYFPLDFRDGINRILKIDPTLQLDTAINKKMDMLIKMEDRLFLNPLAKVKNVPKKEEPKADPLADKGFGNV